MRLCCTALVFLGPQLGAAVGALQQARPEVVLGESWALCHRLQSCPAIYLLLRGRLLLLRGCLLLLLLWGCLLLPALLCRHTCRPAWGGGLLLLDRPRLLLLWCGTTCIACLLLLQARSC